MERYNFYFLTYFEFINKIYEKGLHKNESIVIFIYKQMKTFAKLMERRFRNSFQNFKRQLNSISASRIEMKQG